MKGDYGPSPPPPPFNPIRPLENANKRTSVYESTPQFRNYPKHFYDFFSFCILLAAFFSRSLSYSACLLLKRFQFGCKTSKSFFCKYCLFKTISKFFPIGHLPFFSDMKYLKILTLKRSTPSTAPWTTTFPITITSGRLYQGKFM